MTVDLVVPTIGRPSLIDLLAALSDQDGPLPDNIYLVDDRRCPSTPLIDRGLDAGRLYGRIHVLESHGRGPAAARNAGWRGSTAEWIAFLDDDVIPTSGWLEQLASDLAKAELPIAGSQGRLRVPLPASRRPTDWERSVAGLEDARWITADMAYRRAVLDEVGGFDERFKRAFREDADLALRVIGAGYQIAIGERRVEHPVRPGPPWISIRAQAGNADDVLMARLHGRQWYRQSGSRVGRRAAHLVITAALALGVVGLFSGRRWLFRAGVAAWAAGTADFAWSRIAPGPKTTAEIAGMVATSIMIPPVAAGHWLYGLWHWRKVSGSKPSQPAAVLFDRDGTLVEDVPYNGDPERVVIRPQARAAIDRLRATGIRVGVVSNQSGVSRGLITLQQVDAVNRRIAELLGPVDTWAVCAHGPDEGCDCRKPAPGLVRRAAAELGVRPEQCVVVGDIGSDIQAAQAAGARAILVPTPQTRPEEIAAAPKVADDLLAAVDQALAGSW